ncbi:AAA family ATPase, partial [Stieleria sp. TO1_6]|uniref:AAA family ATPase n=1 Tax=Stieleria tagensis TaxID=2956795 RepID=UPI00209B3B08
MGGVESAVAFSGRIKSGKTTLARRVATELSLPFASFGDFVRGETESRGLDCSDRVILQSVGQEFIDAGVKPFCTKVLNAAGWTPGSRVVVDGVRHIDVLRELQELLFPVPLKLVYVQVSDATQASRFTSSDTGKRRTEIESHATETSEA